MPKLSIIVALPVLNFPEIQCRFQTNAKNTLQIFDIARKKFVDLTPEEWVRQHLMHYLIHEKQYPSSALSVEKQLVLNGTKKRYDLVVYNTLLKPLLIVECKAPTIELNQLTIEQVLRYNLSLNVPYILVTNGIKHIVINLKNKEMQLEYTIPHYPNL